MCELEKRKKQIQEGMTSLGIEFGSTRIKAVLIGPDYTTLASGSHSWENQLVDKVWTYSLDAIREGLQDCYRRLAQEVQDKYGVPLATTGSIGISAMMHGYMAFDKDNQLLVPFRTWRNTMTAEASAKLSDLFQFHIPQRWSIAHLYQAICNEESHVRQIHSLTTLAVYVHWLLTGNKVAGVGEASGMFPIDSQTNDYDEKMVTQFEQLIGDQGFDWKLRDILPKVMVAGEQAGTLTEQGARFLDPSGTLQPGIMFCPPEGDAGTGMVATNSVAKRTGNVSAGTSVFAMIVLEKALNKVYDALDLVTTPDGAPVAMVHCNNCTSDINAWAGLFGEVASLFGAEFTTDQLYTKLFQVAGEGEPDCGGLLGYNYFSGEHITGLEEGRPLFVRKPNAHFSLANFMRMQLYTALGVLKIGLDILVKEEKVPIERITAHGGFFTTPKIGQSILAATMDTPVSVMETATEGGAWGIAILAAYTRDGGCSKGSLGEYLNRQVFANNPASTVVPEPAMVKGFEQFIKQYKTGLAIERTAVESIQ